MPSTPPSHTGPREWDAEVYHRVAESQYRWGARGSRTTAARGRRDRARRRLRLGPGHRSAGRAPARGPRDRGRRLRGRWSRKAREVLGPGADVRHLDLEALELDERVDAVFSNAVFHWITDHRNLFTPAPRHARARGPARRPVRRQGKRRRPRRGDPRRGDRPASIGQYLAEVPKAWNFRSDEETELRSSRTPASPTFAAGSSQRRCGPRTRSRSCGPSRSAPTSRRCPQSSSDPFIAEVIEGMGEPARPSTTSASTSTRVRRGVSKHRNLILCAASEAGAIYS